MKYLIISIVLFFSGMNTHAELREFKPDGCTMFPEGTRSQPNLWAHCCLQHDLFYWAGGTQVQRTQADLDLRQCFRDLGQNTLAELVYLAVRTGRYSPIRVRTQQWGNAWSESRNFRRLSTADIEEIVFTLESFDLPENLKILLKNSLVPRL